MPSADSIAGIRAVTSAMVCPRARRTRARHPHRSTVADWILEPGRPMALEMSGHAAMARCTRARARRRRCAHHGTASTERADAEDLRHRRGERAEQRGDREPAAGREHGHGRVDPFGEPGQADARAEDGERERGQVGDGEQPWPQAGVPVVEPPAGREDRARRGGGRDLGAVPPREPGQEHPGGHGDGLSMTTMGCRPALRARRVCLRICR